MTRARAVIALALTLAGLALAACGGDGDEEATPNPAPREAPSGDVAPPSPSALPPEVVKCFADNGYEPTSPTDIHSAPPQVVQECFGALHRGGGVP